MAIEKKIDEKSLIDLGLSQLVNGASEPANSTDRTVCPENKQTSEYEKLWEANDIVGVISRAEVGMSGDTGSVSHQEATLWWVRGNFKLKQIPTSLLAAPLDTVSRELLSLDPNSAELIALRTLAKSLLIDIAGDLTNSKEYQTAFSLLETADNLSPEGREKVIPLMKEIGIGSKGVYFAKDLGDDLVSLSQDEKRSSQGRSGRRFLSFSIGVIVLSLVVVFAVLLLVYWYLSVYRGRDNLGELAALSPEQISTSISSITPTTDKISVSSNLDALYYGIQNSNVVKDYKGVEIDIKKTEQIETKSIEQKVEKDSRKRDPMEGILVESDGELVESYQVRKFDGRQSFKVVVRTPIMANPRYTDRSSGLLEPGDRVLGDAQVGRWLRIRSSQGGTGYVLMQDLAEER